MKKAAIFLTLISLFFSINSYAVICLGSKYYCQEQEILSTLQDIEWNQRQQMLNNF